MGMNRCKGNMYKDIDFTWNPIAGRCVNSCKYCSTQKLMRYPHLAKKYSGPMRIEGKELKTKLQHRDFPDGCTIFVGAQNDMFAKEVDAYDIMRILDHCSEYSKNKYVFQSKSPSRMLEFLLEFPVNSVFGTTIESDSSYLCSKYGGGEDPIKRANALFEMGEGETFVTIEPIMVFNYNDFAVLIKRAMPTKIYIGADSGKNGLPEPTSDDIKRLIEELKYFTIVHQKENLKRLL